MREYLNEKHSPFPGHSLRALHFDGLNLFYSVIWRYNEDIIMTKER